MAEKQIDYKFLDENGKLLPELRKFNWGACILAFVWGIPNKSYWTLLFIITFFPTTISLIAGLILPIWFGIKGNEWALRNKKWNSIAEFQRTQIKWAIFATIVAVIIVIVFASFEIYLINLLMIDPQKIIDIILRLNLKLP